MQFPNIFLPLILATTIVTRRGRDGKSNSTTTAVTDNALCKEMASLNKLVKLASNETKLENKTMNNATKIADIKAQAAEALVKLSNMKTNTTLTSTCAVVCAAQKIEDDCNEMKKLTKLIILTANTTALRLKAKGNTTKEDALRAEAVTAQTKLNALISNVTLVSACVEINAAKAAKKNVTGTTATGAAASETAVASTASWPSASATLTILNAAIALNTNARFISTIVLVAAGVVLL